MVNFVLKKRVEIFWPLDEGPDKIPFKVSHHRKIQLADLNSVLPFMT